METPRTSEITALQQEVQALRQQVKYLEGSPKVVTTPNGTLQKSRRRTLQPISTNSPVERQPSYVVSLTFLSFSRISPLLPPKSLLLLPLSPPLLSLNTLSVLLLLPLILPVLLPLNYL